MEFFSGDILTAGAFLLITIAGFLAAINERVRTQNKIEKNKIEFEKRANQIIHEKFTKQDETIIEQNRIILELQVKLSELNIKLVLSEEKERNTQARLGDLRRDHEELKSVLNNLEEKQNDLYRNLKAVTSERDGLLTENHDLTTANYELKIQIQKLKDRIELLEARLSEFE